MSEVQAKKSSDTSVRGGNTVVVASKMPYSFILELYDFKTKHEHVMGGGSREVKEAVKRARSPKIRINGNSYAQDKAPTFRIEGGYALTYDVPREFWEEWLSQNKDADYVLNGMIFAHTQGESTVAEAREKSALKSGVERLDPANLPMTGIQTAEVH